MPGFHARPDPTPAFLRDRRGQPASQRGKKASRGQRSCNKQTPLLQLAVPRCAPRWPSRGWPGAGHRLAVRPVALHRTALAGGMAESGRAWQCRHTGASMGHYQIDRTGRPRAGLGRAGPRGNKTHNKRVVNTIISALAWQWPGSGPVRRGEKALKIDSPEPSRTVKPQRGHSVSATAGSLTLLLCCR